jgi:uncharacterized protein YuzE
LRLHATVVAVVALFLALGWWQLDRARSGNELSWAYVVEWPLFAGVAVAVWWTFLHDLPDPLIPLQVHAVSLTLGPATFDRLAYDVSADIMHLHVNGAAPDVHVEQCREGHRLRYDEHGKLVGITLIAVTGSLQRGEPVVVTTTEQFTLDPAALATSLRAQTSSLAAFPAPTGERSSGPH